jgi:peptidoglycan/LPS O-acetylase OafA/YrhL
MIATVDTDALLELAWAAPLAVLVVTVAWALVIRGTAMAAEAGRQGRRVPAALHALVAVAGAALFLAAVVSGLLIMISKS